MHSRTVLAAVAAVLLVGFGATAEAQSARPDQATVDQMTATWPKVAREAASKMMSKYGLPNEATASMLIWNENGPWQQTIVYREEVQHDFPIPHKDVLEQVVNYEVPPAKFDELAAYDGSVVVERTKGVMSARCDKEPMNILALNLADDIVKGRRTVADARAHYAKTAMAAMKAMETQSEMPAYVQSLRFQQQASAGDSDQPYKGASMNDDGPMTSSAASDDTESSSRRPRLRKE